MLKALFYNFKYNLREHADKALRVTFQITDGEGNNTPLPRHFESSHVTGYDNDTHR